MRWVLINVLSMSVLSLTDEKARYVLGSAEGIREALAWAGLDYDNGDHASVVARPEDKS